MQLEGGYLFGTEWGQSASAKRTRGRPSLVESSSLEHRRNVLLTILENGWAAVGWELQQAATRADIRKALLPISQWNRELECFVRPADVPAHASRLRDLRKRQRQHEVHARSSYQALDAARTARDRATAALNQLKRAEADLRSQKAPQEKIDLVLGQIESLASEVGRRESAAAEAASQYKTVRKSDETIREQLASAEAYFCQAELLRFILSGRYRLLPLNFANAMAGLPYMGWRQSFKRCQPCERGIAESFTYQQFKIIRSAVADCARNRKNLEECVRSYLKRGHRERDALAELKSNWYYLRRAIEGVGQQKMKGEELPYRIMAAYGRLIQSRSAIDRLHEEEQRLR